MRRVEENRHASSLQLSKEVESQTGVTISRDTIRRRLQSRAVTITTFCCAIYCTKINCDKRYYCHFKTILFH